MGTRCVVVILIGSFRRNRYAAEMGTICPNSPLNGVLRRNRFDFRPRLRRNGYASRDVELRGNDLCTCFCVDKGLRRHPAGNTDGLVDSDTQKRVRFFARWLWKSLWDQQVIHADSGSARALKRVRLAADSGSGLRRNEYESPQNLVRRAGKSPLKSTASSLRIRFTSS